MSYHNNDGPQRSETVSRRQRRKVATQNISGSASKATFQQAHAGI